MYPIPSENSTMRLYLILFCLTFPVVLSAQLFNNSSTSSDTTNPVIIDNTDRLRGELFNGKKITVFVGNVEMHQGNMRMRCDSAMKDNFNNIKAYGNILIQQADTANIFADSLFYNGNERMAWLMGAVVLSDSKAQLFTDELQYNMETKVGEYKTGAIIKNQDTRLYSKKGFYYVDNKEAYFEDSVVVVDPAYSLKTDTLMIDTDKNITHFLCPTNIVNDENQIYCERGFYDAPNQKAEFLRNPKFRSLDKNRKGTANIIRYDGTTEVSHLVGDAYFEDSSRSVTADTIRYSNKTETYITVGQSKIQEGNQTITAQEKSYYDAKRKVAVFTKKVRIVDPPRFLEADSLEYNQTTHWAKAFGHVFWEDTAQKVTIDCQQADYNDSTASLTAIGRPLMTSLIEGDTVYIAADTLKSFLSNPTDSTSRMVVADIDVRVFKTNLQAICDSLTYSEQDSLFQLFENPIVWSDTSQFISDTVRIQLANDAIDRIFLQDKAFIINSPDEVFFNQVKGKNVIAHFKEDELREMNVQGNGESVYYILDDGKGYIGVNKTICSEMLITFGDNEIDKIKFFTQPKATMYPMQQVNHATLRMEGFRWVVEKRPKSKADLQ